MVARLLGAEQESGLIEIRAAEPSSSLYSAARTLLAVRGEPVALLLDADSTNPDAVARRRLTAEEVVSDVAVLRAAVCARCGPALEARLFVRADPVARAYGAAAVNEQLLELGRMNPREALKRLDHGGDWSIASMNFAHRSMTPTSLKSGPCRRSWSFWSS